MQDAFPIADDLCGYFDEPRRYQLNLVRQAFRDAITFSLTDRAVGDVRLARGDLMFVRAHKRYHKASLWLDRNGAEVPVQELVNFGRDVVAVGCYNADLQPGDRIMLTLKPSGDSLATLNLSLDIVTLTPGSRLIPTEHAHANL
jgi:hypothetical protein